LLAAVGDDEEADVEAVLALLAGVGEENEAEVTEKGGAS